MEIKNRKRIGLALSGGGVRAAAFHSGVLKYLAEKGKLEDINHISSVSGGSLFTGLVFSINSGRWPSSKGYMEQVLPQIKKTFTVTSLQVRSLRVRSFNNFLINNPGSGFYFMIGTSPVESVKAFRKSDVKIAKKLLQYNWLSEKGIKLAAGYKTTLKRMTEKEFDIISRHGYETAKWNFELFGKGFVNNSKEER